MNEKDKVIIIGEIGINHGGDINIAKKLIDGAKDAGADMVKFQTRLDVEDIYSPEELDRYRESPFGKTNRAQKLGIEFTEEDYDEINRYCKEKEIKWFSSAWSIKAQRFLRKYNLPYNKVASAMLTVYPLLEEIASEGKETFISTGMATMENIEQAVEIFKKHDCKFTLMHCNSTYPQKNEESNLRMIETLRNKFKCKVGYSGHELGMQITLSTISLGVSVVERHICLSRADYGSDVSASLEIQAFKKLCRDIRVVEAALGTGVKQIYESEKPIREKLVPYWYKEMLKNEIK